METFETSQPTQPTEPKTTNWSKIVFAAALGFGLLAGAVYGGYWYGTESADLKTQSEKLQLKTQIPETPTLAPEATPTPAVEDETKDWKIYTNDDLGFSIKYPAEIKILYESTDGVTFYHVETTAPSYSNLQIIRRDARGKNPEDAVYIDVEIGPEGQRDVTWEDVQINNAIGIRTTSGFSSPNNYYLTDENLEGPVVRVFAEGDEHADEHADEHVVVFEKMIRTLKLSR